MLATLLALVLGTTIGLIAAYNRGKLDDVLMRSMDVILALPQIISALIVISMFGATTTLIILTVGISTVPRIARVVRGAAVSVVERDFVAAAESLGESRFRILRSELLPNVSGPLLVEANLRLTFSIGLIAGIAFLGFTADPGAANWGLMINENRKGLVPNHWGVTLPVIAIALLTIGTGLIGDGLSRAVRRHRPLEGRRLMDVAVAISQPADRGRQWRRRHRRRDQPDDRAGRGARSRRRVGLGQDHRRARVLGHARRGVRLAGGDGDDRRCIDADARRCRACATLAASSFRTCRRTRRPR